MKIVLIVEGIKDADQIHKAFKDNKKVKTLVTEGTKVNRRVLDDIESFIKNGYTPYILSDPDIAGEHLARMIQLKYPKIKRIEVDGKECAYFTGKKYKAGIEYSSYEYLRKIINPLIGIKYKEKEQHVCWD